MIRSETVFFFLETYKSLACNVVAFLDLLKQNIFEKKFAEWELLPVFPRLVGEIYHFEQIEDIMKHPARPDGSWLKPDKSFEIFPREIKILSIGISLLLVLQ